MRLFGHVNNLTIVNQARVSGKMKKSGQKTGRSKTGQEFSLSKKKAGRNSAKSP
jgi:hypothetical protein